MKNNTFPIDLITITTEKDDLNQVVEKLRTSATVMAEIDSVTKSEFYEAGRLGFQPDFRATIYDFEYTDEPIVKWNGKLYSVYRTYYINGADRVELYCTERGGTKDE
jgi:SPP1 family predicted phage head-tail adaptor